MSRQSSCYKRCHNLYFASSLSLLIPKFPCKSETPLGEGSQCSRRNAFLHVCSCMRSGPWLPPHLGSANPARSIRVMATSALDDCNELYRDNSEASVLTEGGCCCQGFIQQWAERAHATHPQALHRFPTSRFPVQGQWEAPPSCRTLPPPLSTATASVP